MGADYRSPRGPFSGGRAPSGDSCNSVALGSTFVCLGGILHTFAQALAALMSLGEWGAALVRGYLLSKQSPGGPGLGLGLDSSQRPPEGLKSSPDFSGPWTPAFVMDLCAATRNEKGSSRQRAAAPRPKRSPEQQPAPSGLSRFQN